MALSSSSNSPCAACKLQRRKCVPGCVFAPYFRQDQSSSKFANMHRVFGASNVAKLLNELNPAHREDAVNSLAYEAEARLRDPVYGCVGYISILQHRLRQLQHDLHHAKTELSTYVGPSAMAHAQPSPSSSTCVPGGHLHNPQMNPSHPFYQQHHPSLAGTVANYWPTPAAMGAGHSTALTQDQQYNPQQFARQLSAASAAAREQLEMMRDYEQQQQQQVDLMRYGGGFDGIGGGAGGGGGLGAFNQLSGVVTVAGSCTGFDQASTGFDQASTGSSAGFDQACGGRSTGFVHGGPSTELTHAGPSTGLALAPRQLDNPFHLSQQSHPHYQEQQQYQQQQQTQHDQLSRFGKDQEGVASGCDGAGHGLPFL